MNRTIKAVDQLAMGQLIKRFRLTTSFDSQVEQLVRVALRKRNFLAHKLWQRRIEYMNSTSGRGRLAVELVRSSQLFRVADAIMELAMDIYRHELAKRQGVSIEVVRGHLRAIESGMLNGED